MADLTIIPHNGTHSKVYCADEIIANNLAESFKFLIPKARFNPKVKLGIWDGYIRMYHMGSGNIYAGLVPDVRVWARDRGYSVDFRRPPETPKVEIEDLQKWMVEYLKPTDSDGNPLEVRPYQYEAMKRAINHGRILIRSATSSGKSFMIYSILRYLIWQGRIDSRIMVVVPTVDLVVQLKDDFADYSQNDPEFDVEDFVHQIYAGQTKDTGKAIVVTTWQSVQDMPEHWFKQFDCVVGDEAHGFEAKKLTYIMDSLTNAHIRIGLTGTVKKETVHQLTLKGMFGPIFTAILTHEMIENGWSAKLNIACIQIEYPEEQRKDMAETIKRTYVNGEGVTKEDKEGKYARELEYIIQLERRNEFIKNLALSRKGNTLILFERVEKQGLELYELIKKEAGDRPVFMVYGKIKKEDRKHAKIEMEKADNAIIVASYKTFSTGINIKRLHHLIMASPTNSMVRLLQSIGRALRIGRGKAEAWIYDIADDFRVKKYTNYTWDHYVNRLKTYTEEKLPYKIKKVQF